MGPKKKFLTGLGIIGLIILLILSILFIIPVFLLIPEPNLWENLNLIKDIPKSHKLEVPYQDSQSCFTGSVAMQLLYSEPSLTFDKILENSNTIPSGASLFGFSLRYTKNGLPMTPYDIISIASDNGFKTYLSYMRPTDIIDLAILFWGAAVRGAIINEVKTEEQAFNLLKKATASDFPVQIAADGGYILTYTTRPVEEIGLLESTKHRFSEHFVVVTGYNETHVFIHDPNINTEPHENLAMPSDIFLKMWKNDRSELRAMPAKYGMFVFKKTS